MKPIMDISLLELIKGCKKDGENELELFKSFKESNGNYVHEIFGTRKFGYNFTDKMTVYSDGKSLGSIRPSYNEFIETVCDYLGVKYEKNLSEKRLTKLLNGRLKKLETIEDEVVLLEEFPKIKSDHKVGRRELLKLHAKKSKGEMSDAEHNRRTRTFFYKCGIMINIDNLIKSQVNVYSKFIERREEYKKLISEKSYNGFISEHFNLDKVALFLAYNYLEACSKAKSSDKELLLELVYNYLSSDYDKSVSIKLPQKRISFDDIQTKFSGMKKNLVVHVNWEIMPVKKSSYVNRGSGTSDRRTIILTKDEIDKLTEKGNAKNAFYDESNYVQMIVGTDSTYVEYLYPNGVVV